MRHIDETKQNIFGMLELVESEKVMDYINIVISDIVKDACKERKASEAAMFRSRTVAMLGGVTDQKVLEYFYFFIKGKLGLMEEVPDDAEHC